MIGYITFKNRLFLTRQDMNKYLFIDFTATLKHHHLALAHDRNNNRNNVLLRSRNLNTKQIWDF